jgi:hypothetical protein
MFFPFLTRLTLLEYDANFDYSVANPIISAAYGAAGGAPGGAAPGGSTRTADEVEERPEELD